MGQKEISSTYQPEGAERIFLISHPIHVGLVIPRERDPRIAEVFRLFTEGDHTRMTDFALIYPHAGVITQGAGIEVDTSPETMISDFLAQTFHRRGNVNGRFGYEDVEGLEGIVIIVSPKDTELVKAGLLRGFKSEFAILRDRVKVIEVGDKPKEKDSEKGSHFKLKVISKPRKIIELVDEMVEANVA